MQTKVSLTSKYINHLCHSKDIQAINTAKNADIRASKNVTFVSYLP